MKIYLDNCCLNRPFDDQAQARIHLESEAVLLILSRIEQGEWSWISSEVLLDEIEQNPDPERRSRLQLMAGYIHEIIAIDDDNLERAKELHRLGFQSYDALHIACAESGAVDAFLTTDDRCLKLARRFSKRIHTTVINPLVWLEKMVQ